MGDTITPAAAYRKLTRAELEDEARAAFGDDLFAFAFRCPHCGDVATVGEFAGLGLGDRAGQECIGRHLGALAGPANRSGRGQASRGCDWASYGLFRGPWEVVFPAGDGKPERSIWCFPLAIG